MSFADFHCRCNNLWKCENMSGATFWAKKKVCSEQNQLGLPSFEKLKNHQNLRQCCFAKSYVCIQFTFVWDWICWCHFCCDMLFANTMWKCRTIDWMQWVSVFKMTQEMHKWKTENVQQCRWHKNPCWKGITATEPLCLNFLGFPQPHCVNQKCHVGGNHPNFILNVNFLHHDDVP